MNLAATIGGRRSRMAKDLNFSRKILKLEFGLKNAKQAVLSSAPDDDVLRSGSSGHQVVHSSACMLLCQPKYGNYLYMAHIKTWLMHIHDASYV